LLVGMAGILSLGQGAFYGVGAYTAAILAATWNVPFLAAVVCGGLIAAAASLLLIPIVNLKGSSLAVATLGFSIIAHLVMLNEDWLTGGSIGLMDIPRPTLLGFDIGSERPFYYVCLVAAGIVFLALERLTQSRFGRALVAMSQDEEAARASGIAIGTYKAKCFLVAAFVAGIDILIMVVIGGLGSLPGAALGAAIVVLMPEFLRSSGELRLILFGLMVVVLMGAGNRGLAGLIAEAAKRAKLYRPRTAATPAALRPSEP
jgi:branched-chain amino acid transport system permease protein